MTAPLNGVFSKALNGPQQHDVAAMFGHYYAKTTAGAFYMAAAEILAETVHDRCFQFTTAQIERWVDEWRAETGQNPDRGSGPISKKVAVISWADVDTASLLGMGELEGGSSLEHFLCEHGYQSGRPKLSEALALYHTLKFYNESDEEVENRSLPTQRSGAVSGLETESWISWQNAFAAGRKGVKAMGGLNGLYVKYGLKLGRLNKEMLRDLVLEHYEIHGSLPTVDSGKVLGYLGESWAAINKALFDGARGLEKTAGLNGFYIECGFKLGDLNEEIIVHHARLHQERTGKLPTQYSGQVEGLIGESWGAWHAALCGEHRGLSGQTTLHKVFEKHGLFEEGCAPPPNEISAEDLSLPGLDA